MTLIEGIKIIAQVLELRDQMEEREHLQRASFEQMEAAHPEEMKQYYLACQDPQAVELGNLLYHLNQIRPLTKAEFAEATERSKKVTDSVAYARSELIKRLGREPTDQEVRREQRAIEPDDLRLGELIYRARRSDEAIILWEKLIDLGMAERYTDEQGEVGYRFREK